MCVDDDESVNCIVCAQGISDLSRLGVALWGKLETT